ncbi:MAG: vitamin K epoxide reductase family protein [Chloroflexota bacterium]|jgi:thiol-disulfide isomerase/thioredoxin
MSFIPFRKLLVISLLGLLLLFPAVSQAQEEPVVRAVLFYSPTCPHCHTVITDVLIPMVEEHGQRLQIVAVDVSEAGGQALYQSAVSYFEISEDRLGVPTLVVGDTVLVGSGEIPALFPGIVAQGLSTGIDWPTIPGFAPPAEADTQTTVTATPSASPTPSATITAEPAAGPTTGAPAVGQAAGETPPTPFARPATEETAPLVLDGEGPEIAFEEAEDPPADPVGFALASVVLVVMIGACLYVIRVIIPVAVQRDFGSITRSPGLSWLVPLIAILGIGVAAYLAYVEVAQVTAVCGPVGHCNLVQSSAYARILGVPIAILGVISYVAVIGLWYVELLAKQDAQKTAARIGLIGLTVFGTLFSIYLTLLELFFIRAVCAWCLSSAVLTTILMVMAVRPATRKPELAIDG